MSRTYKDAPAARKARRDRRFAERPFAYEPSAEPVSLDVIPLRPAWDDWALANDPGLSRDQRLDAYRRALAADPEPELVACRHWDDAGQPLSCDQADAAALAQTRAHLTLLTAPAPF